MKKSALLFLLGGGVWIFANCSPKTTGSAATSTSGPEAAVAEVKKNYTEAQMEEGKVIWQGNCNKCHKLYEPESHSVKSWEKILPRMVKRAKLDDKQAGMVRAYLLAHATKMG